MRAPLATGEQTTLAWRKGRAGQRLLLRLAGVAPDASLRRLVAELRPAGFLISAENAEDPAQLRELNRELRSLLPAALPPLLATRHAGGEALVLRDTPWPPLRWAGNVDALPLSAALGAALGEALHAMGFNLNLGLSAEVGPATSAFSDRAPKVAAHLRAALAAHQERGVAVGLERFPGHGRARQDTPESRPVIERERPELAEVELRPFRAALAAGVGFLGVGPGIFPDYQECPAHRSPALIQGLLREELGFQGPVLGEDLSSPLEADLALEARLEPACQAGCDLFLAGPDLDQAAAAWEVLIHLQEEDRAQHRLAEDSERRLRAFREQALLNRPQAPPLAVVGGLTHRLLLERLTAEGRP